MKSQFVSGSSDAHEQYLDCSLRGITADTRGGASQSLIADIRIMQDFAAANPDKANTARLNAWVDKVLGGEEPNRPTPTRAKGMTSAR